MIFRFDPREKLVVVSTRLWGASRSVLARLALDTGATHSLLNSHIVELLGCKPGRTTERIQITTGSGVEYVPRVRLERIGALGIVRRKFAVVSHTLPPSASVDGLLGVDFFRGCRLTIDFSAGRVEVRQNRKRAR